MLASFRGLLATWPARIFFALLAASFALWGVANKDPFGTGGAEGVTVGGHTIAMPDIQRAYRQQLAQAAQSMGQTDPSPELRQAVAVQTIQRIATQASLEAKVRDLGLAVPESALRDAAFAVPAFRDKEGKFDRQQMLALLRNNGLTEARFLDMLHEDLGQQQILGAITAGTRVPDALAQRVYAYQHELRVADLVDVRFDTATASPAPTDAQLERWYANHPAQYSIPEVRRIRAIVLTPETVGKDIAISDEDLRSAYEQHKAEFILASRRSVQVLSGLPDAGAAEKLAAQWTTGADWPVMQKAAEQLGGAAVELTDASRSEFPAPELADAAFATHAETVAPPVKGALGWYVLKVTKAVEAGGKTYEQAREELRARAIAEKSVDILYERASRIEDLLAGGTKLGDLPGDLGLAAITGTLDAHGQTPEGVPAPIPGSPELRMALIQSAFAAHAGDGAKLTQAPGQTKSYYALEVESVTPPSAKPLAQVTEVVRADWTRDQARRSQERSAADLLAQVQKGGSLADLAPKVGLTVRRPAATGRDQPSEGVPPQLLAPLFALRESEGTMVETPDGFLLAQLASIKQPDPAADPAGFAQLKDVLGRSLTEDVSASLASAVREAAQPKVSGQVLSSLTQMGP